MDAPEQGTRVTRGMPVDTLPWSGQTGPLALQNKFLSILPGFPYQLSLQIWDVFDKCFDKNTVSPS